MPSPKAGAQTQEEKLRAAFADTKFRIHYSGKGKNPLTDYDEEEFSQGSRDFYCAMKWGHFPELTIEQNRVIWEAREKGWDVFWPSYPSALSQAENTHKGAVEFLKGAK